MSVVGMKVRTYVRTYLRRYVRAYVRSGGEKVGTRGGCVGNLDLARDLVHLLDSREALDVHVHEQLDLLRQVVHPLGFRV